MLPWLRLIRTLRVAGSPSLILLVAVTFAAWRPVSVAIIGVAAASTEAADPYSSSPANAVRLQPLATSNTLASQVQQMIPSSVLDLLARRDADGKWWRGLAAIAWSLLLWSPTVLLLVRQGALLTAGRPMVGLRTGFVTGLHQTPVAWLIASVPLACVLALSLAILFSGWISGLVGDTTWIELPLTLLVVIAAIPCGILAFGANIAVPLGWAAVANERDPDALDSLSRGYEYLLRRPLQLALYALVSLIMLSIIAALATAISGSAAVTSIAFLRLAGATETLSERVTDVLRFFPFVVTLTLFWSLVGGVYLLLRFDAGGQEVEDLWMPAPDLPESLPKRSLDT